MLAPPGGTPGGELPIAMPILHRKCVVFSALLALIAAAATRFLGPVVPALPSSLPSNLAEGQLPVLDLARLSAADRHDLASLEKILRAGNNDGAETLLRTTLSDLLLSGGAPLVDRLLAETPPGALRETLLRLCEILWPKVDAAAALAWTARLPDLAERGDAYERVLSSLAGIDPARAVEVSASRDVSHETNGTLTSNLVTAWATADFRSARRWALNLPSGARRDKCVARVATVEAQNFPADAARFALKRLPSGPVLDETVVTTVYFWAERDEVEARRWVESFPAGPLRDRVLAEVNHSAATVDYHPIAGQP